MKKLSFIILFPVLGGIISFFHLKEWSQKKQSLKKAKIVELPRGASLKMLSRTLESHGLTSSWKFWLYVRLFDNYSAFQAGTYRFEAGISPLNIIQIMKNGRVFQPILMQITIPEGFTLEQTILRLVGKEVDKRENLEALVRDQTFLKELGVQAPSLEGYIYPATYSYRRKLSGRKILSQMVGTFWKRLPEGYLNQIREKNLELHEAVTFASLIELETQHEDEKPLVAEVIWRRLKAGEPLAIDAALIYGIKDYAGDIKWVHLKDRTNPYNTRIHKGLPPGPIGSPSASSLSAVLNPSNEGFYYYVLKADGGNRHHFSTTLSEHNRHVKLLIEHSRKRRLRSHGRD